MATRHNRVLSKCFDVLIGMLSLWLLLDSFGTLALVVFVVANVTGLLVFDNAVFRRNHTMWRPLEGVVVALGQLMLIALPLFLPQGGTSLYRAWFALGLLIGCRCLHLLAK